MSFSAEVKGLQKVEIPSVFLTYYSDPWQTEEPVGGNRWIQTPHCFMDQAFTGRLLSVSQKPALKVQLTPPQCWLLFSLANCLASLQFLLLQTWFQSHLCPDLLLWNVRPLLFFFSLCKTKI